MSNKTKPISRFEVRLKKILDEDTEEVLKNIEKNNSKKSSSDEKNSKETKDGD